MAENDSGERTEKPTPKKLKQAREKGQVARSKELTTAFLLVSSPLVLLMTSSQVADGFKSTAKLTFSVERSHLFNDLFMFKALAGSFFSVFESLTLVFLCLFLVALIGPIAIGGLAFSTKAMAFKGERLSPLAGFKRMFGVNALMELLKSIAKFSLVAVVAFFVVDANFDTYVKLGASTPHQEVSYAIHLFLIGFLLISLSLILIAIIDVPFQIWNHQKQLKMTRQEIKDEFKDSEGRPEVKARVRQLQHEMTHRRMMEAVPEADVVVVNPEHYSVALKYDQLGQRAPVVVATGVDIIALNIRKVAKAHDVAIIEAPPLARALYHTTKLDQEIPAELFLAVAQLLAYVFQMQAYSKGKAEKPKVIREYPIPDDMQY